ncbi:MAG: isocitrate/isopropylmalate dehydrogenase family protein [Phycisphaerales bacterium]|nr:isocitrate/isopropylmalate dehydrogenase family protein [Phycisphaerales bacterium]
MAKYKIAWMPGDGVGNDVMNASRMVLDKLGLDAEYIPADIGWEFWTSEGNALPDRTVEILKSTTCALFGAITSKPQDEAKLELAPHLQSKGLQYFSPIVKLRQLFNLHTNMRPCKSYPGNPLNYRGTASTNPSGHDVPIDQVIFRENTEGMYGGVEFFPLPESVYTALCANPKMKKWKDVGLENVAFSSRIVSTQGCTSICRQAFEFAKKFGRKRVTLIEKPNVLRETGGLMTRCFRKVAADYPGIRADEANIDAICMWMFKNPQDYDVLVAENMFGDIVSDLCAGLVGGLGFAPSANMGDKYAVFEPTHGSAPKYAGQYKVNPIAMLLTAKLMLDWLGEKDKAARLDKAIAAVIAEGKVQTYDMKGVPAGQAATTTQMAQAIAAKL